MLTLYHRTGRLAANSILADGFQDATGTYLTANEYTGVWLSDVPLNDGDYPLGDVLLCVRLSLSESAISEYEWIEESKPYREWLIPADFVNSHGKVRIAEIDEEPEWA